MATLRMLTRRETGFARLDLRVLRKQIRFKLRTAIGQSENRNTFDALEWRNYSSCWRNTPRPVWKHLTYFACTDTARRQGVNPVLDWAPLFPSGFDLVMVPGDHFTTWEEPDVEEFARIFEAAVAARTRWTP